MTTQIIWGGTLLTGFDATGAPVLQHDAGVVCEAGLVVAAGPVAELKTRYPEATVTGGRDFAIMPGFVNAHHHVGLTPLQLGSPDHPLELWFASRIALRDVDLHARYALLGLRDGRERRHHGAASAQPRARHAGRTFFPRLRRSSAPIATSACAPPIRWRCATRTGSSTRRTRISSRGVPAERPAGALAPIFAALHRPRSPIRSRSSTKSVEASWRRRAHPHPDRAGEPALALGRGAGDGGRARSGRTGLPVHMHVLETPYQKAYARRRTGGSALSLSRPFRPS